MKKYFSWTIVLSFVSLFSSHAEDLVEADSSSFSWYADSLTGGSPLYNFVRASNLESAQLGILVKEVASGRVLADYHSKSDLIPASVTKVITTATALELFSDTFRFVTKLECDGRLEDSVLYGNVYVTGGGDPTLGSSHNKQANTFFALASTALRNSGVRRVAGRVVGDASLFEETGTPAFWLIEDMGTNYSPTPSALSFNDNLLTMVVRTDSSSARLSAVYPANRLFKPQLKLRIQGAKPSWRMTRTEYSYAPMLAGSLPANGRYTIKTEIPDPALFVADSLSSYLSNAGIPVDSASSVAREMHRQGARVKLLDYYSPMLKDVILQTNYKSLNLYAENIFSYLSLSRDSIVSRRRSSEVVSSFWKEKGLASDKIFQVDGSGLSMKNAINASFLVDLLMYMKTQSRYSSTFVSSLPIAGVNGTVKSLLSGTPLSGKVYAKSGSMERVQNYCGYIHYKSRWYAFCIMVNNYSGDRYTVRQQITRFLNALMEETNKPKLDKK